MSSDKPILSYLKRHELKAVDECTENGGSVFLRNGGDDYQTKRRHSPHTTNINPDTAIIGLAFINSKTNTEIKPNYTICMQRFEPWT